MVRHNTMIACKNEHLHVFQPGGRAVLPSA